MLQVILIFHLIHTQLISDFAVQNMATKETKKTALNLYKQLLRGSTQFVTYNYRAYGWRHTKYTFRCVMSEINRKK